MVPMVYQWNINAKNQVLPRCDVAIGEESHAGELGIDHICILPRGQETQGETWEVSHIPTSTDLSWFIIIFPMIWWPQLWDIPHVRTQPYMRQHYCVWSWWAIGPVYLLPWSQYALPNASVISLKVPVGEDMANDVMPWCLLLCMCFIHSSGCRGKLGLHFWTERIMAPSNWPLCWSATTMSKHICSWTAHSKWLTNHENPLVPRKGYLPNNRNRRCQN